MNPLREKNDADILFRRIKDVALRHGQSAAYIRWKRSRRDGDVHHVFGSMFSRKSTDYLTVLLTHAQHMETHSERDKIIALMPDAINDLIEYTKFLEARIMEKGSNERSLPGD